MVPVARSEWPGPFLVGGLPRPLRKEGSHVPSGVDIQRGPLLEEGTTGSPYGVS